jgi:AcrR family transcriptional regulator
MGKQPGRRINRRRRAEIGAERRSRTRAAILDAALELLGHSHGRATRIEDVCAKARIARGTFYNYFTGMEELLGSLSDALTRDFDAAVHIAFASMSSPVERTCAAIRYYLHGAVQDRRWGWAMVNSSVGTTLYGEEISNRVKATIQEGMDSGDFSLQSADVGRDIVLGTGIAASISSLKGGTAPDYPERVAYHLLIALGTRAESARLLTSRPLAELPQLSTRSRYFTGTLGGDAAPAAKTVRGEPSRIRKSKPQKR